MNKLTTHNVFAQTPSVQTEEEFEALLEKYKNSNPEKYAIKLANGEYDRYREKMFGAKKKEKVEEVEAEKVAEEAVVPRRGRPSTK